MKLKTLLKGIEVDEIKGNKEIEVAAISANSKNSAPGTLFLCKKGSCGEGHHFITEAVEAGARSVVTDMINPFLQGVVQVICKNPAAIEAKLASRFYQEPSKQLFMVGVTGTSGKTTCSFLAKHLIDSLFPCGLIGTIEYIVGKERRTATLTTPDAITNQRLLKEMAGQGCQACVMEVSSHALEQGRVDEIAFDVVLYTNLTPEHLDYHQTMQMYAEAKKKLFSHLQHEPKRGKNFPCAAIINNDCPWHKEMIQECKEPIITYGIENRADVWASHLELSMKESKFVVHYKEESLPFTTSLLGAFNVRNSLAVVALGLLLGVPLKRIQEILQTASPVQGRLESVPNDKQIHVYVDYAHKPDALQNVLQSLAPLKQGKLITVFGCGGNRDRSKRPKMARVAEELSDEVIVTSDNPRDEPPFAIIDEIIAGFQKKDSIFIEEDRRRAIALAVKRAQPGDTVLIAGKGHETYQVVGPRRVPFDDRLVAQEELEKK